MSEKTQIYDTLSEEQKTVQIPYYLVVYQFPDRAGDAFHHQCRMDHL